MILETRIVWKEPFKAVGQKIRYKPSRDIAPSENEISRLWQRFNPRCDEIPHKNGECYGLCIIEPDMHPGDAFDYVAAVGVTAFADIPEGMVADTFEGGLYAVVTRKGPIDELGATFDYYHGEWLPNSEYTCRTGAEVEFYDSRYMGNDNPESVMELWFPIRSKRELPIENRVASLFVHVSDLRRAAEWYSQLLGLPLIEERLNGGPVYWLSLPGTGIVLDSDAYNRQNPDWRGEMQPLFMLAVPEIDEAYAYVVERTQVFGEIERHGSMAYFNFADSEGNSVMACWSADAEREDRLNGDSPVAAQIAGVFVDVTDMRRASGWYTDLLGLPLDEERALQAVYSVPVAKGAALLLDSNRHAEGQSFSIRCMFDTKDIQAACAYAEKQGFEFHSGIEDHGAVAFFVLKDPDGNLIMVCESCG